MKVKNFQKYGGLHCESTATGSLLKQLGIELSEAMVVGLGEGLNFIFWKMSILSLPFIGGRSKQFALTTKLCENLGLELDVRETASKGKAWTNLKDNLDHGLPVGLQLDCYHLEYFSVPFHFPGHFVTAYDYDDEYIYLLDTGEFQKTSIRSLELARFEKGSMSAKARSWTISPPKELPEIKSMIPKAIHSVANQFINPPISALGYKGIKKMSEEIVHWIEQADNPSQDIYDIADLMENGGTGGALFRNLFRDFLNECQAYYPNVDSLNLALNIYKEVAPMWTEVSNLLKQASETLDVKFLTEASLLCQKISTMEYEAMILLANADWGHNSLV
ncbi:MAG: BtrH N-terminal domain-containing protein [Acholeplasma sp.]|nr:BtrH N-terminal domain-containing protein [Acholeplasma sp.]